MQSQASDLDGKYCFAISPSNGLVPVMYSNSYGKTWYANEGRSYPDTASVLAPILGDNEGNFGVLGIYEKSSAESTGYYRNNDIFFWYYPVGTESNEFPSSRYLYNEKLKDSSMYWIRGFCVSSGSGVSGDSGNPRFNGVVWGITYNTPTTAKVVYSTWNPSYPGSGDRYTTSSFQLSETNRNFCMSASACSADGNKVVFGHLNAQQTLIVNKAGSNFTQARLQNVMVSESVDTTPVLDVAMSFDGSKIAIVTTGSVYISTDGGSSFRKEIISNLRSVDITADGSKMFLSKQSAASQSQVLVYQGNQLNSLQATKAGPTIDINRIKCNGKGTRLVAFPKTANRVHYSEDGGDNWTQASGNLSYENAFGGSVIVSKTL